MQPLRRQHPRPQAGLPTPLPPCLATWAARRWLQGQPHRVLPALLPLQHQQSPTPTRCPIPGRPQLHLARLQQVRSACYASCSHLLRIYYTARGTGVLHMSPETLPYERCCSEHSSWHADHVWLHMQCHAWRCCRRDRALYGDEHAFRQHLCCRWTTSRSWHG